MNMAERSASVQACKWADVVVLNAPYNTEITWIDRFGCYYVVHGNLAWITSIFCAEILGDDVSTDADGLDTYRFVKQAGRFKECARTRGISTTDLIDRMLHPLAHQHLWETDDKRWKDPEMIDLLKSYSSDKTGHKPCTHILNYSDGRIETMLYGQTNLDCPVVYVDGSWDLFTAGHVGFLHALSDQYNGQVAILVGVHDDKVLQSHKTPVMNYLERVLMILACCYPAAVLLHPPKDITEQFLLHTLPSQWRPSFVYSSPCDPWLESNRYDDARRLGMYREIKEYNLQSVTTDSIVWRIHARRDEYAARQARRIATSFPLAHNLQPLSQKSHIRTRSPVWIVANLTPKGKLGRRLFPRTDKCRRNLKRHTDECGIKACPICSQNAVDILKHIRKRRNIYSTITHTNQV